MQGSLCSALYASWQRDAARTAAERRAAGRPPLSIDIFARRAHSSKRAAAACGGQMVGRSTSMSPAREAPSSKPTAPAAAVDRWDRQTDRQTDTIRYDTRCYFNVRSKADISQLNLPHGTDN